MASSSHRRLVLLAVTAALTLMSGCGSTEATEAAGTSSTTAGQAEQKIEVVEVYNGFDYYGACGNERLSTDTTTYYPLAPDEVADIELSRYPLDLSESDEGFAPIQRVAEPGPGDDVGLLLVYDDGLARFESDSGWVIWLTDQEKTYEWDC